MSAFNYRPGPLVAVCHGPMAVLLDLPAGHELVAGVHGVLTGPTPSVDEVLDVLVSLGLRTVATFAVAEITDAGTRVVVRGAAHAQVAGREPIMPSGLWENRFLDGVGSLTLAAGDTGDGLPLPLDGGIVLAATVTLNADAVVRTPAIAADAAADRADASASASGALAADPIEAPGAAPSAENAGGTDQAASGLAEPAADQDAAGEAARAADPDAGAEGPAAELAAVTDGSDAELAVVTEGTEPSAEGVATPGSDESAGGFGPDAGSPDAPAPEATGDGAVEAAQPDSGSGAGGSDEPLEEVDPPVAAAGAVAEATEALPDFDHLFGATQVPLVLPDPADEAVELAASGEIGAPGSPDASMPAEATMTFSDDESADAVSGFRPADAVSPLSPPSPAGDLPSPAAESAAPAAPALAPGIIAGLPWEQPGFIPAAPPGFPAAPVPGSEPASSAPGSVPGPLAQGSGPAQSGSGSAAPQFGPGPVPAPRPDAPAPAEPASRTPLPASPRSAPEMTIDRDQLIEHGGVSAPLVVAARCPDGHLSPAYAGHCRVCGKALPAQQPFEVPRPSLGVLRLSNGDTVALDRSAVLGRNPRLPDAWTGEQPNLVKIHDPNRDVSGQHLEVRLDFWHVLVRDLGSTNGTEVVLPGAAPVALRAHDAMAIEPGTRVILAGVFDFTYEVGG